MTGTELLQEIEKYKEDLVNARRYLHSHPEIGFNLPNTVAFIKKELLAMGYEPKPCGKSGLTVLAGGKKEGKVFMIRGDMDALPISEEAHVNFASQNGNMHACGHDMHTTMLLGAAKLLKAHEDEIEGTIKLDFQPSEENFQGANDMIQAGLLENPSVDAALMIHVMANLPMEPGTVIISDGGVSAPAADYFKIHIQGKGCHGSMPNNGVDPINAAAHIITALQEIHARELALSEEAVLTFGTIQGGMAENAIPDTVDLGGTLRTYDEDIRDFIKKRMVEISKYITSAFRAEAEVTFGSGCPTLVNNADLSAEEKKSAVDKYAQLSTNAEKELLAESSIKARGYENAVVTVIDEKADVIILSKPLEITEVTRIQEIVKSKTGVKSENITITVVDTSK